MFTMRQKRIRRIKFSTKVLWAALAVACYAGNDLYAKDIPKAESSMSQSQEQIRIQGRILDQSTNEPIAGVSIRLNGRTLASSDRKSTRLNSSHVKIS